MKKKIILFFTIVSLILQQTKAQIFENEQYIESMKEISFVKKAIKELSTIEALDINSNKIKFKNFKNQHIQLHIYQKMDDSIFEILKKENQLTQHLKDSLNVSITHFCISLNKGKMNPQFISKDFIYFSTENIENESLIKHVKVFSHNKNYTPLNLKVDNENNFAFLYDAKEYDFLIALFTIQEKLNWIDKLTMQKEINDLKKWQKEEFFFQNLKNISFLDKNHNTQSFEKFAGKYIKFYFWNIDCKKSFQEFEDNYLFETQTAEELNIEYVAICFFDELEVWKKIIEENYFIKNMVHILVQKNGYNDVIFKKYLETFADNFPYSTLVKMEKDGNVRNIEYFKDENFIKIYGELKRKY